MDKGKYIESLENCIRQMLTPLKDIPLSIVIEVLSGHKIIPFSPGNPKDKTLLANLIKAASLAGRMVNKEGIKRPRPNEVGNDIEPFVKLALNEVGYTADTPLTKRGKRKTTGYPDIEFTDANGRINYLECKTYNIKNISTTQRSFYLSPSDDFKITKDAHHFVISYEIYTAGRSNRNNIYKCKSWKILTLENVLVDVKYEFNCDNAILYSKDIILAEGLV